MSKESEQAVSQDKLGRVTLQWLVCLCVYVCVRVFTCKRCQESGGSPVPWSSLQHRKQPWVQEISPPSEGGRKAEDKHVWSHTQTTQMTTKFNTIAAPWRDWLQLVDTGFDDCWSQNDLWHLLN